MIFICRGSIGERHFRSLADTMTKDLKAYEEAISAQVCTRCLERTGRAICGTGSWDDCALNRFLPEIVSVVNSVQSDSVHDSVHDLHKIICVSCRENVDGFCELRASLDCPLDQYFVLIVRAIQDVNARTKVTA